MDIDAFRDDVACWFRENQPEDWLARMADMAPNDRIRFERDWLQLLNTKGFGAPHVPKEWGGGGYDLQEQVTIYTEWAKSGAPRVASFDISIFHVPGTLLRAGSRQQQERYVRQAIGGVLWCQGFSEPDAGSDLASLRTRAVRDGDEYVVTGQKIWSSFAAHADYCLLLARTDPDAPKHAGISYLIMDMHSRGVEVRPIKQSTGHSEFNEVFMDGVRVPAENLIGAENDGWRIAQSTLSTERGTLALEMIEQVNAGVGRLDDLIQGRRINAHLDGSQSQQLSQQEEELAGFVARSHGMTALGQDLIRALQADPGNSALASVVKVASSEMLQDMTGFGSLAAGQESLVDPKHRFLRAPLSEHWMMDFVHSWFWTISAGTNEIQRNIIAERLLELPKEPRPS